MVEDGLWLGINIKLQLIKKDFGQKMCFITILTQMLPIVSLKCPFETNLYNNFCNHRSKVPFTFHYFHPKTQQFQLQKLEKGKMFQPV